MKKTLSVIGVMVALVLSLTGCMKMDVDLVVESPEKASMDMVMAFDTKAVGDASVADLLTQMGTSEEKLFENFPEDAQKSPYEKDGYKGYTFSVQDRSLTDMGDISGELGSKVNIAFTDGQYHFAGQGLSGGDTSTMNESTMTVSFPGEVVSASKGATIEGNTVSFDMLKTQGAMTAVANPKDNTTLYLSFGMGGLALLGAIIGVSLMRRPETDSQLHA